jgi:hypothetical protein
MRAGFERLKKRLYYQNRCRYPEPALVSLDRHKRIMWYFGTPVHDNDGAVFDPDYWSRFRRSWECCSWDCRKVRMSGGGVAAMPRHKTVGLGILILP